MKLKKNKEEDEGRAKCYINFPFVCMDFNLFLIVVIQYRCQLLVEETGCVVKNDKFIRHRSELNEINGKYLILQYF